MNALSRLIANRIAPEAVKPFWSEVIVYGLGSLASIGAIIGAITLVPARVGSELGLLVWLNIMIVPVFPYVLLGPLIRQLIRFPVRRNLGLPTDPTPWWFRMGYIRRTPDMARQVLPEWQIAEDRYYLPGFGHSFGLAVTLPLVVFVLCAAVPLYAATLGLTILLVLLALPVVATLAYWRNVLPAPGETPSWYF